MEAPRRLYTTEQGEICEADDPRARFLLCAKGMPINEEEAKRMGLVEYLAKHPMSGDPESTPAPEAQEEAAVSKMVPQAAVEDKAVSGPTEAPAAVEERLQPEAPAHAEEPQAEEPDQPKTGAHFPPETRRIGGGGRRGSV